MNYGSTTTITGAGTVLGTSIAVLPNTSGSTMLLVLDVLAMATATAVLLSYVTLRVLRARVNRK